MSVHHQEAPVAPDLPPRHGGHAVAAAAGVDGAGADAARADRRQASDPAGALLHAARRGDEPWTPADEGALKLSPTLAPLEAHKDQVVVAQQPCARDGRPAGPGRQRRRSHAVPGGVSERRSSQAHRRRRHPCRHDDRSDGRGEDRPGHAAAVARTGDRGLQRPGRLVRRRVQLHLHEHDLLAHADVADADGDQPARRVRSDVRRRRHRAGAAAAHRNASAAFSMRSPARSGVCRATSAPSDRNRVAEYLDTVREIERRIQLSEKQAGESNLDVPVSPTRHSRRSRGAHETDVRPDGDRVPGRHHAHLDVHDGARGQLPHVPDARHLRSVPPGVASSEQSGTAGAADEDQHLPCRRWWRTCWRG